MTKKNSFFILIFFFSSFLWNNSGCLFFSQSSDKGLIKADQLYINHAYPDAAEAYENFLKKSPKDFYASRQAALSHYKNNNQSKAVDHWVNVYENALATDQDKLEYAKCLLANFRTEEAKKIFLSLANSNDLIASQWAKAYANPGIFYEDSALCKVYEVKGSNTKNPEFSPLLYKDNLVYVRESGKKRFQPFSPFKKELSSFLYEAEKEDSITFKKGKKFNKQMQNKYINGSFCFTPDDSTMYFTRSASTKLTKKASHGKARTLKLQIFYTAMNGYGLAHTEIHPFKYNSFDYNCMHPTISIDGKKMFFASDMPGTLGGLDIFVCDWKDGDWDTPRNLGPNINTTGNESFPDITEEGILFFSSDSRPGLGGLDVFYADPTNDDKLFAEAENSGTPINSQNDDFGMFTSKNAKKGYFGSNRKNGFRDDDIFYFVNYKPRSFPARFRFVDSASLKSLAVDFTVSIGSQTYHQKLDTGAFFATRIRAGRDFTINASAESFRFKNYVKNVVESDTLVTVVMVPKSLKCIEGKILDKDNNQPLVEAKVAIYDEDGNKYLDFMTDSTGRYKVCYLPLDKSLYIGSLKKPDYFTNTEKFIVRKDTDVLKDIYAQRIVVGKAIKVDNIYFDKGKFNVRADAALELDKLVRLMKDNPEIIIELSSHTDCIGLASANLLLSDKRAKSSAAYIVSKGVAKTRIKGKGYGESQLLNACKCEGKVKSTCSEEEHAQNRRAEFKVTGFVVEKAVKK